MCITIAKKAAILFPKVLCFHLLLAEVAEEDGKVTEAHEILQSLFQYEKTYFTFSVFQRFLFRNFGVAAARLLFSSTYEYRLANPKEALHVSWCFFMLPLP